MSNDATSTMRFLSDTVLSIRDAIDVRMPILYVDFPAYNNVGDMLIYLGSVALIKKINSKDVISTPNGFTSFSRRITEGRQLIFQGGGNFGDLYPEHDDLRIAALEAAPSSPVVFLPQTIYYTNVDRRDKMAKAIAKHGKAILFCRDAISFEFAIRHFDCDVRLAPDMAHLLYDHKLFVDARASIGNAEGTLHFLRRDVEQSASSPTPGDTLDWDDLFPRLVRPLGWRALREGFRYAPNRESMRLMANAWTCYCSYIVGRATKTFERYGTIATDRLHGHILGLLIGRKVMLKDNSYGKNSGYYASWTHTSPDVTLVPPSSG
jgi:pyruvyl transferase EpsO